MSEDTTTFSNWLTKRMGVLGLKNADVANATGVTGPAVSLWRTAVNVPNNDRIGDLADILQVTPETILVKLGRMKPRAGITGEWEALITRFQDAGPEAEQLLFAIGDALLLALTERRTQTELEISLDPIFNAEDTVLSPTVTANGTALLFYDRIRLPNNHPARLSISCSHVENNQYNITLKTATDELADYEIYLVVGKARYDGNLQTLDDGLTIDFNDVIFSPTVGEMRLMIE